MSSVDTEHTSSSFMCVCYIRIDYSEEHRDGLCINSVTKFDGFSLALLLRGFHQYTHLSLSGCRRARGLDKSILLTRLQWENRIDEWKRWYCVMKLISLSSSGTDYAVTPKFKSLWCSFPYKTKHKSMQLLHSKPFWRCVIDCVRDWLKLKSFFV